MTKTLRASAMVLSLIGALMLGRWIGEDLAVLLPWVRYMAACVTVTAVALVGSAGLRRAIRVAVVASALVALAVGALTGIRASRQAFNECISRGPEVQERLRAFRAAHGRYPVALSELGGALPGQRLLRGSMLSYSSTGHGYELRLSDWLVTFSGTHSEPWVAHK